MFIQLEMQSYQSTATACDVGRLLSMAVGVDGTVAEAPIHLISLDSSIASVIVEEALSNSRKVRYAASCICNC